MNSYPECPSCGSCRAVKPKLILVDKAWIDEPGIDPRLKYFTDLRADDIRPEFLRQDPFQQFVDAFYCENCSKGFIPESMLTPDPDHRRDLYR